ncbi:MAG: murein L,D-transpeptidase YcbB/YkuD [Paracoccaceae bacterium]|jgi:murein L,D-transpeptidase YcbB/YkuD
MVGLGALRYCRIERGFKTMAGAGKMTCFERAGRTLGALVVVFSVGAGGAAAQVAPGAAPFAAPMTAPAIAPVIAAAQVARNPIAAVAATTRAQTALSGAVMTLNDSALTEVYGALGFSPIWLGDRPARVAASLLAVFDGARAHALPAVADTGALRLRLAALPTLTGDAAAAEGAALDVALSLAALRYGTAVSSGALTPRKIDDELHIDPVRPDRAVMLGALAAAGEPRRLLEGMAPADPGYDALRDRLAAFRRLVEQGGWTSAMPDASVLRQGDAGPQVARLRARLVEMGDSDAAEPEVQVASNAPAAPIEAHFDAGLEAAVMRFQRRHGLNADGVVGRLTFDAMAVSAEDRLRQIAVNLERMRWMNRDLGSRRIVVNQADFTMTVYDHDLPIDTMRVVIGLAKDHRTPEFSDVMTHMVVNPTWNVPRSIATKEILPELRADPGYLARNNMSVRASDGSGYVDPYAIDWTAYSENNFPFRVRQEPGDDNALGHVKFMFPNNFAIYMHDTPSRRLFAKDMRAFSHGCVRLERPIDLAHLLLQGQVDDPVTLFDSWLERDDEIWVKIRRPLDVHLTYRTVWVDGDDGADQFRADIYGRDATVWAALAKAGLSPL